VGNKGAKIKSKIDEIGDVAENVAGSLLHVLTTEYLESYPGNLFKNQDKQEELKPLVEKLMDDGFQPQPLLFTLEG
jgi:hypothetical protein